MQNMLTKNKFMPTALSMYINYFLHGIETSSIIRITPRVT